MRSTILSVRTPQTLAVEAQRLARWRGESLSHYVARLIERDVASQRHTLKALEALEAAEQGGAS